MNNFPIASKLADMAELEIIRAETAQDKAAKAPNTGMVIKHLADKDKHLARSEAFSAAAKIAMAEERQRALDAIN